MYLRKRSTAKNTLVKAFRLFLPQICLTLLCVVYLWISALIFRNLDQSLADQSIYEIILFEFSALTTIGYGNIAPSSNAARAFCVLFALFGMPLLYLTLANFGKHASKGYWYLMSSLGQKAALSHISKDSPMPLPVILFLFVLTFLIGSHSVEHTGERGTIDEIYFSFISFATVGFGDKTPKVPTFRQLCITVAYLTWGCILTTTLFTVLSQYFRKVQYLGRRFTGTRDVSVWMGGRKMTVSRLVQVIANEFDASPREIRSMLRDLDEIIPRQIEDLQEEEKFSRTPLIAEFDDFEYIDE